MNFSLFTIPIFLFLVAIIPSSFSQDSSVTDNGFFGVEQNTYILKYGDEFQIVKISGIGEMSQGDGRAKAVITITNPDSTENSHRIIAGSDGYFELTFPLYYHSQTGTYKAFATFERYVLGEVFFTVERLSITESDTKSNSSNDEQEHVFEFKTSTFEVATDSTTYQKGEIIHIIGVVPTQPNLDLTLQITNPLNNRVLINQITPNPDGTFEDSVNTSGSLWNSEGDYNIRINYNGQDLYSTFSFSIPTEIAVPNPITSSQNKIKTTLTLDNFRNTYDSQNIPISGYLIADGNGLASADIHIIDNGVRLAKTLQTDSNGYFAGNLMYNNNKGYHEIQLRYDGTAYFESSKSRIKNFDLVDPTTQNTPFQTPSPSSPPSSPQSEDYTWVIGLVILLIIGGIVAAVAKNRKKNKFKINQYVQAGRASKPQTPPSSPPSGPSRFARTVCKKCRRRINPASTISIDGTQTCPYCGTNQ